METLRDEIIRVLGIDAGLFTMSLIEEAIAEIDPVQYGEFFKALMGDEHAYLKPLDRVVKVARQFVALRKHTALIGTQSLAKQMYDRFYAIHTALSDYAHVHMKESSLGEFFGRIDYRVTKFDGFALSAQEFYVLKELGGGAWLYRMKEQNNSGVVVAQIAQIIEDAIMQKLQKQIGKSEIKRIGT